MRVSLWEEPWREVRFAQLFQEEAFETGAYLDFLNMGPWSEASYDEQKYVQTIGRFIRLASRFPGRSGAVLPLLQAGQWEEELPAIVWALCHPPNRELNAAMWRCFAEGSWVSPQLAVGVFLRDPEFAVRAETFMRKWPEVAAVPAAPLLRPRPPVPRSRFSIPLCAGGLWDFKGACALLGLACQVPALKSLVDELLASTLGKRVSENDPDDGAQIAKVWLDRATKLFRANGVLLEPFVRS